MNEPTELKAGSVYKKQVGDQYLILKPIPYGRLKELMKVIFGAMDQFAKLNTKDIFLHFPKVFEENLPVIMPLMFSPKEHSFMNSGWIDENLSLVDMREIVDKMIIINGLQDFLGSKGRAQQASLFPANPNQPKQKVELTPVS